MRGFASIATGYSGLELMVGYPEIDTSTGLLPFGLGDTTMAIQAVAGALAALHHREQEGVGQFVDVSQIDSATATLGEPLLDFQLSGRITGPQGNRHTRFFPHGIFAASGDEKWLALAVRDQSEWKALCRAIGRDDWKEDASFGDAEGRRARAAEIDAVISAWCGSQERDAAAAALTAAGVPAAPVLDLEERNAHAHFEARGLTLEHDFEGFDACRIYATPWLLSATPAGLERPTPTLGKNNDYVFRELLELGDDEIERLQKEGVLV
jgi:crotonobetainyl-CoA:carnitine CoA-transferase CaiB-like acyl-CoA transferase